MLLLISLLTRIAFASVASPTYPVAFAHAYRYTVNLTAISILIKFPLDHQGTLINWNQQPPRFLPNKFMISDGTLIRPFLQIDKTPGSELNNYLISLRSYITQGLHYKNPSEVPPEVLFNFLTKNMKMFIDWSNEKDDMHIYGWHPTAATTTQFDVTYAADFTKLFTLPVGQWIETTYSHLGFPFRQVIMAKKGFCIDMVLLSSFILESFNIQHRVVFGSVLENDSLGGGHTWIQLNDGRILDVAWQTLDFPKLNQRSDHDDWLWFGNAKGYQYRYAYNFFPITIQH